MGPMFGGYDDSGVDLSPIRWLLVLFILSAASIRPGTACAGEAETGRRSPEIERWLKPQDWQRDSDKPILSLGEPGRFDDTHIFAPSVIYENGQYRMYYCGSQGRVVDQGIYQGKPPVSGDPKRPRRLDQRLFKVGLALSTDGIRFAKFGDSPVFEYGDRMHSIVTPTFLRAPDGSLLRENGKLRMWFAAVDFPQGTYKHDLHESTSADGIHWTPPSPPVMENAYAPSVIKENGRYRMWFVDPVRHPWCLRHAQSSDGSSDWRISEKPCIVMDQDWENKDLVYPTVVKVDGVYVMMYGCYWNDDVHTALGMAVSKDGLKWTKNPHNPVFRPEPRHPWESHFTTSQTLMRMSDGSWRLWYASRTAPPWTNLYFAIGTARWAGPAK